ncbi:MAG: amino acid adenylation domain-containing protein, partial [Kiritimatiellales bacterium]
YNIPLCFHIAQSVDAGALKKACRFLLDQYPVLASTFVEQDGELIRETRTEPVLVPVSIMEQQDVSALDPEQLLTHIRTIAKLPFELDSGPLVRFHLFSRGRRDNYLLLTLHHIVFDGGSFLPVVGTLLNPYRQIAQGKTPTPSVAADHYPDFVQWEQKMLSGAEGHKHRAYWTQQLSGKLPGLNLFTDYPRAASSRFEGRTHSIRLDSALSGQIRSFARQQRRNLSTLFLALYNVLLHRYTGQDDIIIGMPEKGRSQERFDSAVGYFINMLPIRSRDLGQKPFAALIRDLQLTMTDALDHATYPFPVLVSDLGIAPTEDFAPVFKVAFEYQNVFSAGDLLTFQRQFQDALSITLIEEIAQEGEYELVLEVREGKDDFALNLKYNPTLFKPSTIARLAEHLVNLAGQAIAHPQQMPAELGMLADHEQKLLLDDWNNTAADYPAQQCFHQLFEQQARLTPNAAAVVFEHQQLSYAELDQKSTQLAKYLQQAGVEPDQLVAVCVDRSVDMMVALLGVAKSGAAWLPMDPRYPADRLGFMLQDSQALMVLTQADFRQQLHDIAAKAGLGDFPVISLDSQWDDIERQAQRGDLRRQANADHLAYVIYTSGSTGVPKGVMIRHRSLTNFLLSMAKEPGFQAGDRLLAVTTYCFDIAALELLLPLVRGGCCCICASDKLNDSARLQQEIKRLQPTVMQATPSTWTMLFHGGWRNEEGVKILCGGEPLPQELKQYFAASGSEAWNMYGPTETTIWSTVARISKDEPINIGKPIANTQVYIVDSNNRLAPIGLPGELCIGGDGLAKGYLNNPRLTAEKFIDNPLKPGSRLYRTGDLARRREDGVLEHLGRLDHQVKIRGYRIELGEIESWLNRHAAIRQSVVVAREQQGGKQLVAYYVKHSDQDLPQAQLQNYLAEQLPDYMVPAIFVAVPEIPLMANGKTDRNALASREPVIERKDSYVPPQSEIERAVLAIWQALLNIGTIGVTDGFFELGGNSVLSVMLAQRISEAFDVKFSAPDLFKYPTVQDISLFIGKARGRETVSPSVKQTVPDLSLISTASKPQSKSSSAADIKTYPDYYQHSLAIIGMSCHVPGAKNPMQFWRNLRQGKESATLLSVDELRNAGIAEELINNPNFVPLQYSMEGKDLFDPGFFNISPKNAAFMDPQFRMLLQHSWQAIEDAGYVAGEIPETAVFMSASNSFYKTLLHNSGAVDAADEYAAWIAGQGGTIPTMISYQLGLKGPSFAVHSNCSSSLVGLYLANQSLQLNEAKYALIGGATLFPIPGAGHVYQPGMNFSSDGHCKAFDASADGLVGGEGVAVVMVKKAIDAIEDGDHIYALVRGVAVNNDGSDKAGFYVPSVKGQADVIQKVLSATGVNPETIGYVEAHGTGTKLGDPVEVMALNEVYQRYTAKKQFCGIGSVKPNIGHLDTAAGLAGVIKVALSLQQGEIPPSINYKTPNPEIDFTSSAFRVVDKLTEWPNGSEPRRAALSSFGIGGTNAHAILEEYPSAHAGSQPIESLLESDQVIALSAKTEAQLQAYAAKLLQHVAELDPLQIRLQDLAFTLQTGREAMPWRAAFRVAGIGELAGKLKQFTAGAAVIEDCFQGQAKQTGDATALPVDHEDGNDLVTLWLARGRLDKVARAWAGGLDFDWSLLHQDGACRRISLPTYPFAEERYWPGYMAGDNHSPQPALSVQAGVVGKTNTVMIAHPVWKPKTADTVITAPVYGRRLVMLCGFDAALRAGLEAQMKGAVCIELKPTGATPAQRYQALCEQIFDVIKRIAPDNTQRSLIQLVLTDHGEQQLYSGLSGLLKTAALENPKIIAQLIVTGADNTAQSVATKLTENSFCPDDSHIRYMPQRMVIDWETLASDERPDMPWKERGVYLITGGSGGLGIVFAEEIARQLQQATLVLVNRSELTARQLQRVESLRSKGISVVCQQADVSRQQDVDALIADIIRQFGTIDGILHGAGVIQDNFILNKPVAEFEAVLAAKVAGTLNLDSATRDVELDFFVLFSSAAAVFGSAGQADYCAANAFMDAFAHYRNEQVASKQRRGHTLAIDWPLWQHGGMRIDEVSEQAMRQITGIVPMQTEIGIQALYRSLASGRSQTLVLEGDAAAIKRLLAGGQARPVASQQTAHSDATGTLRQKTVQQLKYLLAETVRMPSERIQSSEPMEKYGIDSIAITQLNQKLEQVFGSISKTLFYQYQTVDALAGYLAADYPDACLAWTGQSAATTAERSVDRPELVRAVVARSCAPVQQVVYSSSNSAGSTPQTTVQEPIAIIGISGRYPQADTLEAFWENLKTGKDCISEIPSDRWPMQNFFDADPKHAVAAGKSYSKWGGFLDSFADFDPLFFNISPREALTIDPQERLFLQCAWQALEDAGYTRETLRQNVGVFTGITKTGFDLYGPELWRQGRIVFPHTSFSSVANRISYCLNLHGPSMPIDTMCSSALTAIHEACQHIRHGDCDMAIAGGVNLYLHPSTYVGLCSVYMLSQDGQCKSFGKGGNGFVPGEGVGAVLLKRLSQAVRDGDPIHAVIRGSAVNHGGKTNGYTVPNPNAQAELIKDTLQKAGVDARTVSYMEAHGTGTELGDPIEMTGLTEAFRHYTNDSGFCALGSVKSNMGHLEAAAGMAGLSKIILQMRHGQIAPSLHASQLNPNIDFAATPFIVQQQLADWRRPTLTIGGETREFPRRAGLSSFGAGGSNAHLVIEEYIQPDVRSMTEIIRSESPAAVIVLSAKTDERLREVAANLLGFLNENEVDLHNIAYTLQVGREALDERLGLLVSSVAELKHKLAGFLDAGDGMQDVCRSRIQRNKDAFVALADDEEFQDTVDKWISRGKYTKLLDFWVKGLSVDWAKLYPDKKPQRIHLPVYPFAKQRYWLDVNADNLQASATDADDSGEVAAQQAELIMMCTVWDALTPKECAVFPSVSSRLAIVGGTDSQKQAVREQYKTAIDLAIAPGQGIQAITEQLRQPGRLDHIVWIAPECELQAVTDEQIISAQQDGVMQLFRLVKALLAAGYADAGLGMTVITTQALSVCDVDRVNPVHAAVHGLVGSIAKEYPTWELRALDVADEADWPVAGMWQLPPHPQGGSYAWRGQDWLQQKLALLRDALGSTEDNTADLSRIKPSPEGEGWVRGNSNKEEGLFNPPHPSLLPKGEGAHTLESTVLITDVYRHQGVYVVIGGAGGLGETWSRAMIRDYQAGIIWLGRSEKDATIQAKLDALAEYGAAPEYIQADARDPEAMQQAYRQIKQRHGNIHGLIVSTLGEYDQSLAQMSEDLFRDILSVKLDVDVRAVQLFQDEPLDFVVFFSSMVAFGRSGGMSAYASACTFNDAFARQLSHEWACAVKVINWGYWDVGGGTRISGALKSLVEQRGVQPIDAAQGLAALKTLLGGPMQQLAVTRTGKPELIETFASDEWTACAADKFPSCMDSIEAYRPIQTAPEENPSTGQLNDWIVKLLFVQLQAMGLFLPGHRDDPAAMRKRAGILDKYDRWWRESLNILQERGYLRIDDGCFVPDESAGCESQQQVWRDWKTQKQHYLNQPEARTLAVLVDDCLTQLPEVLRGTTLVTDVLFPNGSMDKIEGLYKNNRVCDYFNDVVAGVAETYIRQRINDDPAARIRIIEIGAGTGGTTSTVLPHLNPLRQYIDEYCYTDMSKSFFIHAKQRYGTEYPYLSYKLCNIEQPLAQQDIAVGSYDIAIATNVLHATRSMRNTLRNAKAALRGNGIVILNEISDKTVFASVLFGLIDGWSLAEDEHLRIPGSPGLFPESWRTLLYQEGFRSVLFPAKADHSLGQQIIAADSDGVIRQQVTDQSRIQKQPGQTEPVSAEVQSVDVVQPETENKQDVAETVQSLILDSLASALSISRDMIEPDVPFSDYGIDSILGVGFIQQLNNTLSLSMNTTILFDYATVERLTGHIIADKRHSIRIEARPADAAEMRKPAAVPAQAATALHCVLTQKVEPEPARQPSIRQGRDPLQMDGIAVIGMSGQFPGAKNVDEFWQNMISGVDPVTELPEHYLGEQRYSPEKQPGKSYCKWGGVLEGRDCFDPMFFNISPREAESMNPHQRLILQESWKALEDAGYNPKSLADSRTGIFVGSEPTGYVHETFTGASEAIVASRLSYFLNLKGPAFVVNTGCSSSGVALHLACESLRNRESDLALSGGVFAVMGQTILVGLAQTDMLTHKGRCFAFDADADGMVMSEGVGMVALKRLDQALVDGDAIYGVIRASGINQDGASNGITAPNGIAQQQLITDVYRRYQIDPERISYIETHGTGTQLGDPIEANALARAFREFTDKTHYCAIGSAKSHIGHTSSNSGVTGLISLLLSLKHHKLPGLRHFKRLNPLIEFEQSAFYPSTQQSEWRSTDGKPLMAAMNSFGHGGTNAHLVVEEFVGGNAEPGHSASAWPELIVVSAKDEARLTEMAANLNNFVKQSTESRFSGEAVSLADIAYTLQAGREAMEQRVAFVVYNLTELSGALAAFLNNDADGGKLWTGYVEPKRNKKDRSQHETEISQWLADGALDNLAASWVQGAEIDWLKLRRDSKARRIHLPSYPFARERYWKPNEVSGTISGPERAVHINAQLHPLVQSNTSTLYQQRFQTTFTGAEFFLSDHIVQGQKLLPGVAYLEMARAAVNYALGHGQQIHALRLNNIIWTKPLAVTDGAVEIAISLNAEANGSISYQITSGQAQLHNQGVALTEALATPEPLDLSALRAGIDQTGVTADLCYAALESAGVQYGPAQKGLQAVYTGRNQVLAKLVVPDVIADTAELYALHPSIMDSALQATIALALSGRTGESARRPVLLPFALESLEIFAPCRPVMWTWIRASAMPAVGDELHKLDIDLCTEQGEVCVRMLGFTSRVLSGERIPPVDVEDTGRAAPHPLLHSQDADGQRFVTRFSGNEFFLRDHSGMLPGAVYLEMARAAAHCGDGSIYGLSHIVWPKPMLVNEQGSGLITRLTPDGFSITTRNNDGDSIHCQGKIITDSAAPETSAEFDIEAIQSRCASVLSKEQCDRLLDSTHGPALLSIEHLRYNDREALARLELPDELKPGQTDYVLHPSLLNGAILTGVVWTLTGRPGAALPMPFSMDQLRIYRPLPQQIYAYVRRHGEVGPSGNIETVDIDLLDSQGLRLASLQGFTTVFGQQDDELVFATPEWRDQSLSEP